MARMLFVNWKDTSRPASQFTYPGIRGLHSIFDGDPVTLQDGSELYIDPDEVLTAYLVDVPDGTLIQRIEPLT